MDDNGKDFSKLNFHQIEQKQIPDLPMELECQVHNVLTVVKEAIEKLKISLILPQIFENPKILHKYLKDKDYENCLKLVKAYRDKRKHETRDEPTTADYQLITIIDYFHVNYKILEDLPNWLDDIDNTEKTLLKAFDDIYQVAQERFYRPAMLDLLKEKRLHEVYLANEKVKAGIIEIKRKIENKKFNYMWKHAAKSGVIQSLEDELAFHQYDNNMLVNKEIAKTTQEIRQINATCATRQRELEEELEKSHFLYEKTLKDDLIQEKLARDEKNKYQLQLKALITKYDQTIFEKHKEEYMLQEEYDKQKLEFDEFMIEYNRADAIYEVKVRKIEREEKRLHDLKILLFTQTRAAKKIQRWFKNYLREQRKLEKLRAKKSRKGGKEKAAAEKKGGSSPKAAAGKDGGAPKAKKK